MTQFNDNLLQLQEQVAEKKRLDAKLASLRDQRRMFDRNVLELRLAHREEQADVEKLEGRSLANYYYRVVGRMDEKLNKEREEAYAAKVKLDAAERALAEVDRDIEKTIARLAQLHGCEKAYADAMERKRSAIKSSNSPEGARILELEERIGILEAQKKEIKEAVSAGYSARSTADRVLSSLSSAENWNTWDMFGGGGIITHVAKHSHLDDAQTMVESLHGQLRRFKTELADIHIDVDMQVNVDGFMKFADYFFDGLFADWAVGNRISSSLSSVQRTRSQISAALSRLSDMENAVDREIAALTGQLEALTLSGTA